MTGKGIHYKQVGAGRKILVEQIKLFILLSITGCSLIAMETTILSHIPLPFFGWVAAPSLSLLFCMAVGFLYDEREGGIAGLLVGWLSEATGEGGMMLLPLLYFLCGYMSGTVGKRRLAHNLPSFVVFSVVGGGLKCLLAVGEAALYGGSLPPSSYVFNGLLPAWILTILASVAVYGLIRGEQKLLEPK